MEASLSAHLSPFCPFLRVPITRPTSLQPSGQKWHFRNLRLVLCTHGGRCAHGVHTGCWEEDLQTGLYGRIYRGGRHTQEGISLHSPCSGRLDWVFSPSSLLFWEARNGPFPLLFPCSGRLEWALFTLFYCSGRLEWAFLPPFSLFWEAGGPLSPPFLPVLGGWRALFTSPTVKRVVRGSGPSSPTVKRVVGETGELANSETGRGAGFGAGSLCGSLLQTVT